MMAEQLKFAWPEDLNNTKPKRERKPGYADADVIEGYWLERVQPLPNRYWLVYHICHRFGETRIKAAIDRMLEQAQEASERGERVTTIQTLMDLLENALRQQTAALKLKKCKKERGLTIVHRQHPEAPTRVRPVSAQTLASMPTLVERVQ
jgi:hypothetical protein